MKSALITGCNGLVGSECVTRLLELDYFVVGIDNNGRAEYFGKEGDTSSHKIEHPNFKFVELDIATPNMSENIAWENFDVIIHCAAQPSHDLANEQPVLDFSVNVLGTLNILEYARLYSPKATFIHLSTTKVYGSSINNKVRDVRTRYHSSRLINEDTSYKGTKGVFGANKLAADIIVQEYASTYGMTTVVFRPGCITGKNHEGTRMHGFLSYLAKCIKEGKQYIVNGYQGKQVRDQLHVSDLVSAFIEVINKPKAGVYVIGGGSANSISILEAIEKLEVIIGKKADVVFDENPRLGDHKVNVHFNRKFTHAYPNWKITKDINYILNDLI